MYLHKMAKRTHARTLRFGPRYGRTIKVRLEKVEREQKAKHICPFCKAPKVTRVAAGIWACKKCEKQFTGRAYVPA